MMVKVGDVLFCHGVLLIILFLAVAADQGLGLGIGSSTIRCSENGPPIRFPFHLQSPHSSSGSGFTIYCTQPQEPYYDNDTILNITDVLFRVRSINYASQEIQINHDPSNCLASLFLLPETNTNRSKFPFQLRYKDHKHYTTYAVFNCSSSSSNNYYYYNDDYYYYYYNGKIYYYNNEFCGKFRLAPSDDDIDGQSFQNCTKMYDTRSIPDSLYKVSRGSRFDDDDDDFVTLGWSTPDCRDCEAKRMGCRFKNNTQPHQHHNVECFHIPIHWTISEIASRVIRSTKCKVSTLSVFCLMAVAASFYVFTLYKKDREQKLRIREFLKDYFALKPSRYTYSDIKKFTNNFKEKLGEGAYGTVFKGKLSNKVMVAVKILNDTSKGNDGEEFLNEVATIGQIHHVNVVRLVGYCAEGFKRALVYEFLPNGSLHNYISLEASESEHQYSTLSWETLQDVAKGVAKGIEYLHQGCEQRILHFDIKPHNVLLDHNFKPKVSDFGLAKLCSRDQSLVSVTTARGTLGYMAPEVFSKNFGNVSYKSDVYSFGMLLLKIVGGQNITSKTDEIYYPEWIYNLLEEGESFEALIENEEDRKIAKKLATIGFWCIQWHPIGRPAMKTVVQMLETEEILNLPPNPFVSTTQSNTHSITSSILKLETIVE
ncbi:rust resistance kinase Lr10-like [Cannabis sativa]|uniref:rust resistance kinase Lr10-like n=1 Tax=Cannabis sativa TaxID=3483 RepID=UPI0029CA978C|nr:rust resistance kinase Lr10-like [Cannabis sativa]